MSVVIVISLPEKCPVCGSPTKTSVIRAETSLVCSSCGYVFEDRLMDTGPEWRSFDPSEKAQRSRVGAPLTERIHDKGVTTYISITRDPRSRKLQAIQNRVRIGSEKRLVEIMREVNSILARLKLPERVAETTARFVKILFREGVIKKSNLLEYVAASISAAAKVEGYPITMKKIAKDLGIDQREVWSAYRRLYSRINASIRIKPPSPSIYVPSIVSKLGMSSQVEALAVRFAKLLATTKIAQGKPPEALAAASVYLASILLNEKKNQQEVASTIRVSDATIRNRYRDIVDNFYIEVRL